MQVCLKLLIFNNNQMSMGFVGGVCGQYNIGSCPESSINTGAQAQLGEMIITS